MPRFKFQWTNLPKELLSALVQGSSASDDPAELLRKKYGARPSPDFIQTAWQGLLETWLRKNPEILDRISSELREKGLGDNSIQSNFDYVSSCRNTSGLRGIVLKYFVEYGEKASSYLGEAQANSSHPSPDQSGQPSRLVESTSRVGQESPATDSLKDLRAFAINMISNLYGVDPSVVYTDNDGDILVPSGSACIYIRTSDKPPSYTFFSPVLTGLPGDQDALILSTLNELNSKIGLGRFSYVNCNIILEHMLVAMGTNNIGFAETLRAITALADKFDHLLQARFGGQLYFRERSGDEIET